LQDRIAFQHAARHRIEAWGIQRVSHLADQPAHGIMRQPGVRIQGDDEAHLVGQSRETRTLQKAGVRRPAQQPVHLVQLATLALPADPAALARIPHTAAMQHQETVSARPWAMQKVETGDTIRGGRQERFVAGGVLRVTVRPVREQGKMQCAVLACQEMELQPRHLLGNGLGRRQQRGHGDQRAQAGRNAIPQFQPW